MTSLARERLDSKLSTRSLLPWTVWALGCLFYFYEFMLQVSPSVMGSELMRDFAITSQTLGMLSGFYYYSYTPMQLPCGILIDRFGPHRSLIFATAICALSTIAFSMTNSLYMAYVARLMIGFGSAFAAVGTMKLASNWFSTKYFPLLTGFMVAIGMLGAIGGEAPLAILVDAYGWRQSMLSIGVAGILLTIAIIIVVRDQPKHSHTSESSLDDKNQLSMWDSLTVLIKNRQLWLVAVYGSLMFMATPVFCGLWGVPFLMEKLDISKAIAANYVSLVFVGWAIASPLWGMISNRIGLRKPPMYIASVGTILTSLLFIYAPVNSGWFVQSLLLAFGLFSAGFLTSFSIAKELCSRHYVATGLGFMNMFNMIGVAFSQPFIGYVLDKFWSGEIVNNVRLYPLKAYYIGLALLPAGMVIALLILPFIKETYCQSIED